MLGIFSSPEKLLKAPSSAGIGAHLKDWSAWTTGGIPLKRKSNSSTASLEPGETREPGEPLEPGESCDFLRLLIAIC
jgi:hypothetical protein